jgi:hypothetical protein
VSPARGRQGRWADALAGGRPELLPPRRAFQHRASTAAGGGSAPNVDHGGGAAARPPARSTTRRRHTHAAATHTRSATRTLCDERSVAAAHTLCGRAARTAGHSGGHHIGSKIESIGVYIVYCPLPFVASCSDRVPEAWPWARADRHVLTAARERASRGREHAEMAEAPVPWTSLGLAPWVVRQCESLALKHPTPVQANCLPAALRGEDVIGCAPTGSGKTAAFALPILNALSEDPFGIFAVVMTPTRCAPPHARTLPVLSAASARSLTLFRDVRVPQRAGVPDRGAVRGVWRTNWRALRSRGWWRG